MHPNKSYRAVPREMNIAFAQTRAFGTLAISDATGPLAAHVPFLLSDDGTIAEMHLVRSNPVLRAFSEPVSAVIAVIGADGYVSPDWYGTDDMVPTWNYVAVHLRGTLEKLPQEQIGDVLDRQSASYEGRIVGKTPWTMDKMADETRSKMMRMIVPVRLTVTSIDGTWKLGQNKAEAERIGAAHQMGTGIGQELGEIARLMGDPPA